MGNNRCETYDEENIEFEKLDKYEKPWDGFSIIEERRPIEEKVDEDKEFEEGFNEEEIREFEEESLRLSEDLFKKVEDFGF